jgi:hypothetical protein
MFSAVANSTKQISANRVARANSAVDGPSGAPSPLSDTSRIYFVPLTRPQPAAMRAKLDKPVPTAKRIKGQRGSRMTMSVTAAPQASRLSTIMKRSNAENENAERFPTVSALSATSCMREARHAILRWKAGFYRHFEPRSGLCASSFAASFDSLTGQ